VGGRGVWVEDQGAVVRLRWAEVRLWTSIGGFRLAEVGVVEGMYLNTLFAISGFGIAIGRSGALRYRRSRMWSSAALLIAVLRACLLMGYRVMTS
jgi:hypothetical protein